MPSLTVTSSALELRSDYQNLVEKAEKAVSESRSNLLIDMLKLETKQKDWQGIVILEIRYPKNQ
jgi:hypothetical protein